MGEEITERSVVAAVADQASADLGDEVIVLGMKEGLYFGLDGVGSRVWALLREPRTVAEIRDTILGEYEVEPERCTKDLLHLLGELASHGLVEVRG